MSEALRREDQDQEALTKEVPISKVGSALFAIVLFPGALLGLALLGIGAWMLVSRDGDLVVGLVLLLLGATVAPISARAAYVFAARAWGRVIEPLLPWWITIAPAVVFTLAAVLLPVLMGEMDRRVIRAWVLVPMLVAAPFLLRRAQRPHATETK